MSLLEGILLDLACNSIFFREKKRIMSQPRCTQPMLVSMSCRFQEGLWHFCRTVGSEVRQVRISNIFATPCKCTCLTSEPIIRQKSQIPFWRRHDVHTKIGWVQCVCDMIRFAAWFGFILKWKQSSEKKNWIMSQTRCTHPILVCTSCHLQKGIWLFCRTIGSEVRQVHLQGVAKIFEIRTCLTSELTVPQKCQRPFWKQHNVPRNIGWVQSACSVIRIYFKN